MQLSLVVAFIPIVNILWCGVSADSCFLADLFLGFGYSRECVVSSLATILLRKSAPTTNECSLTEELLSQQKNSTNTVKVVQALHQEAKSERENITTTLTQVKTYLQEIKFEGVNSSSVVKSLFQEIKSEGENSSSVVKSLLQDIKSEGENSSSVMKTLLQELKSERENSVSEIKALLQEIKSERENSSSVVKTLLQELKSERENSVSEIKTLLQELKTQQQNEKKKNAKFETVINSIKLKNCADLRVLGNEFSGGVQTVYPYLPNPKPVVVYCDQVTDGGGWTVIQSRSPLLPRENFTRSWNEYVEGFGDPKGEFWLGLDNIHALTNSTQMELRIDLEDAEGQTRWAHYATFRVGDAASKYVLRIGNYSGDAGDGMTDPSPQFNLNGTKFSTFDNDNDHYSAGNCADYNGGWWYNYCSLAHLNGLPIVGQDPKQKGIRWGPFRSDNHSMKKASMKIRPVSLCI